MWLDALTGNIKTLTVSLDIAVTMREASVNGKIAPDILLGQWLTNKTGIGLNHAGWKMNRFENWIFNEANWLQRVLVVGLFFLMLGLGLGAGADLVTEFVIRL